MVIVSIIILLQTLITYCLGIVQHNVVIFSFLNDAIIYFTSHSFNARQSLICDNRISIEYCFFVSEVAICYVSGDPHYRTFDGLILHYQGVCRYNLASSQQHFPTLPYFRVLAKNERRPGSTHVSYTRYVDVEIFGHNVRLDKGKKVYVSCPSIKMQLSKHQ